VRINSIRLQNFRQHAETSISFETGLTGIIGANGTGKSTLLEAIAWALYGSSAARGTRESIKFLRAPQRAPVRVELEFELGAHQYRVVRSLTNAELYLDRAAAPIANSTTGVTEVLRRRLGMSREEFFNTYFTGQKELSVMASMGPTDRAAFLSRLLGYERLKVAQEIARDRRKAIVAESTGVRAGMPDPDTVQKAASESRIQLADAAKRLEKSQSKAAETTAGVEKLTPQWEDAQVERDRLQRVDSDLRVAESDEVARKRELERQDRELAELASAQTEMAKLRASIEPLLPVRAELETMDRLAREEGRRQTLARQERDLTSELTAMRERRGQLETAPALEKETTTELKRRRTDFTAAEKKHEAARTEWVRDAQEVSTKIESLKASIADYRHQKELLLKEGENGTCPICSKPLGDHYQEVLSHLEGQIESQTQEEAYLRKRSTQLKVAPKDVNEAEAKKRDAADTVARLEKKLGKIQLGVQELAKIETDLADREAKYAAVVAELAEVPGGYVAERHAELRKQAAELQQLESRVSKLAGAVEREGQLRLDRERSAKALAEVAARLVELRASRAKMAGAEKRFEKVRAAYDAAVALLRTADLDLATAKAKHASAVSAVEVAERAMIDLERAIARLEELNRERRLHEELDRAYADLRTDLNQQLRPEISDRASLLLAELTDGRYDEFELDESYNIVLLEDGLPKQVISGGEQDLANLVLRIAISEMIAERAGQPLSLLILDEVFGSLDESRRTNVVALLRRLHERFEQVIVITHVDLDNPDVEHLIRVSYDKETGTSRVEQAVPSPHAALDDDQFEIGAA
jgi:exonuclease SbcC